MLVYLLSMAYQHVLLIDDDADDQEIFVTALEAASNTVTCKVIGDARLALKKLEEKQLAPDVIFLDLNMPVMNGEQFLAEIKKNKILKEIPVIIFSTTSNPSTILHTKDLGAIDFVTKPNKFDELVTILRSII